MGVGYSVIFTHWSFMVSKWYGTSQCWHCQGGVFCVNPANHIKSGSEWQNIILGFCSEIWNVHMWRWEGRFISYLKYHWFEFYLSIGSPLFRKTLLCGHRLSSWAASLHWSTIQRKQSRLLTCCALCSTEHRPFGDTTTLCRLLHKFNGFLSYKIFKYWFEYLQCKK